MARINAPATQAKKAVGDTATQLVNTNDLTDTSLVEVSFRPIDGTIWVGSIGVTDDAGANPGEKLLPDEVLRVPVRRTDGFYGIAGSGLTVQTAITLWKGIPE